MQACPSRGGGIMALAGMPQPPLLYASAGSVIDAPGLTSMVPTTAFNQFLTAIRIRTSCSNFRFWSLP